MNEPLNEWQALASWCSNLGIAIDARGDNELTFLRKLALYYSTH